jgi:hypothetical protein
MASTPLLIDMGQACNDFQNGTMKRTSLHPCYPWFPCYFLETLSRDADNLADTRYPHPCCKYRDGGLPAKKNRRRGVMLFVASRLIP